MSDPGFWLLTHPADLVPVRTVWSALGEQDQDAVVNGMWFLERQDEVDGPSRINLVATVTPPAPPSTLGVPRCRYWDSTTEASERAVTVIDTFGWRARTRLYVASPTIATGDLLTVVSGTAITGDYGKLVRAGVGQLAVAVALVDDGTWLEFIAIPPAAAASAIAFTTWSQMMLGGM